MKHLARLLQNPHAHKTRHYTPARLDHHRLSGARVRFKLMWSNLALSIDPRSSDMTEPLLSDAEFVRKLGAHPDLRSRMESLLLAVEDETGDFKTADAAEMRVIQE